MKHGVYILYNKFGNLFGRWTPTPWTNINNMMQILNALNLRQLVRQANNLGITKEEVVTIQQSQGQFYLVYYSKE